MTNEEMKEAYETIKNGMENAASIKELNNWMQTRYQFWEKGFITHEMKDRLAAIFYKRDSELTKIILGE